MFTTITLKYHHEIWPVRKLLDLYNAEGINLSPHYQRNAIWTTPAQRKLIETIQNGYPIPNFFVRMTSPQTFEMVDGQQRCRSIIGYWNGEFSDSNKLKLSDQIKSENLNLPSIKSFLSYKLDICVIEESMTDVEAEQFYVLVNRSGMRLNRPELRKAEFYDTRFLSLATEIANDPLFDDLSLFSETSENRMNNIDFVSELLTFLKHGFTDKKEKVDATYVTDITKEEYSTLKQKMLAALGKINALDSARQIAKTRFKQKGDFYTLFAFIAKHSDLPIEMLLYCYDTLRALSPHIRPSQEECDPLMTYALNCVSQSNSKRAREARHQLYVDLFLNNSTLPNDTQETVRKYLGLPSDSYFSMWNMFLLKSELINL